MAILCMAWLSVVYRLAPRATQGLLCSMLNVLKVQLPVPDYTTLCRRRRKLAMSLPRRAKDEPLHVVVDATGITVYGDGEWKVRRHGWSRRRTQAAKSHAGSLRPVARLSRRPPRPTLAAMDSYCLSCLSRSMRPLLRSQTMGLMARVRALRPSMSLRHGQRSGHGALRVSGSMAMPTTRPLAWDENLRCIRRIGRAAWKEIMGYHRRGLAETATFRVTTIFGHRMRARGFEGQGAEILIRCVALNRMTHVGMPNS